MTCGPWNPLPWSLLEISLPSAADLAAISLGASVSVSLTVPVSVRVPIVVIKLHGQKQLWGRRGFALLTLPNHSPLSKEGRAGTWR